MRKINVPSYWFYYLLLELEREKYILKIFFFILFRYIRSSQRRLSAAAKIFTPATTDYSFYIRSFTPQFELTFLQFFATTIVFLCINRQINLNHKHRRRPIMHLHKTQSLTLTLTPIRCTRRLRTVGLLPESLGQNTMDVLCQVWLRFVHKNAISLFLIVNFYA